MQEHRGKEKTLDTQILLEFAKILQAVSETVALQSKLLIVQTILIVVGFGFLGYQVRQTALMTREVLRRTEK